MKQQVKILFIVKKRLGSGGNATYGSSGLLSSAGFLVAWLRSAGISAKVVAVTDNNDIDREVTKFRPTHVIIEALWVVPNKFEVLRWLHPNVKWIIRCHSNMPFLAHEGIAMDWLVRYAEKPNVWVAFNSERTMLGMKRVLPEGKALYLPNDYPIENWRRIKKRPFDDVLNIGCFGSIRPMKNHLSQALAAIYYARDKGKFLRFHINLRAEQGGEEVLKNLRALFAKSKARAELIGHPWMPREDFLQVVNQMDLSLQVSMSETFNIVAADATACGVPMVVSREIEWACPSIMACCGKVSDIVNKIKKSLGRWQKVYILWSRKSLRNQVRENRLYWLSLP